MMERRQGEKKWKREQRVHERRQGVPFPVEPDSANGQLVPLREEFRSPY